MNKIKEFIYNYWWIIISGIIVTAISPQEKLSKYIASAIIAGFFGAIIVLFNKLTAKSNEKNGEDVKKEEVQKEDVKKEKIKKDSELKKEEKNKPNIFIILLIILLAVNYIWKNEDTPISSMSNSEFSKKTDNVFSELNKETNKFDTNEQLYDELKKQLKDNDNTAISAFYGFITSANILNVYCKPTGYIPEKYIKAITSYQNNINLEEELIKSFINMGASRNQSLILVDKYADNMKEQFTKLLERDYQDFKKVNPSYTKKEYCKFYDLNAKEIISFKINEIKKHMPYAYKTYFQMK